MNNITIAGILGKDAELRFLPNGDPVCGFSVADSMGRGKPAIWWRCSLFGKRAELLTQYLLKGSHVSVSGSVIEKEYTDKDGVVKKSVDVRVTDVALQGGKPAQAPESTDQHSTAPRPMWPLKQEAATQGSGFDDMDDDIPF